MKIFLHTLLFAGLLASVVSFAAAQQSPNQSPGPASAVIFRGGVRSAPGIAPGINGAARYSNGAAPGVASGQVFGNASGWISGTPNGPTPAPSSSFSSVSNGMPQARPGTVPQAVANQMALNQNGTFPGNQSLAAGATTSPNQTTAPAELIQQSWMNGTYLYDPRTGQIVAQSGPLPPQAWSPQQRQFWNGLTGYQRSTFNQNQSGYSTDWQNCVNQNRYAYEPADGHGFSRFNQSFPNQSFYNQTLTNQNQYGYSLNNIVVPAVGSWQR